MADSPAPLSFSAVVREYILPYNTLFAMSGVIAFMLGLVSPLLVIAFGAALLLASIAIVLADRFFRNSLIAWRDEGQDSKKLIRSLLRLLWPTAGSSLRTSGVFWVIVVIGGAVTIYGVIGAVHAKRIAADTSRQASVSQAVQMRDMSSPLVLVLPFSVDARADPTRDALLAEGITEEVILRLSRFSALRVMGRNSASAIKNSGADIPSIRDKYGVRYVLHGSFRTSADKFRLSLELLEAQSSAAVWSERLEGPQTRVLDISDDVARSIVGRIASKIMQYDVRRSRNATDAELTAYELTLRARSLWNRPNPHSLPEAQGLLGQAIKVDPSYAPAYAYLAFTHLTSYNNSWSSGFSNPAVLHTMIKLASRALELDPHNATAHAAAAIAFTYLGRHEEALAAAREAARLNENDPDTLGRVGQVLSFGGDHEQAANLLQRAVELDPFGPAQWFNFLSRANFFRRHYDSAIANSRTCIERANVEPCKETMAAALALSQRSNEAGIVWREIVAKRGKIEPEELVSRLRPAFRNQQDLELLVSGLKIARDASTAR